MSKKKVVKKSKEKKQAPSFEEALEQIESIVHDLEEEQIGLEESLARYESGVKLLRRCYNLLEHVERRIELLSQVDDQGNPTTEPFGEENDETLSEKAAARSRRRTASGIAFNEPLTSGEHAPEEPGEPHEGIDDSSLLF